MKLARLYILGQSVLLVHCSKVASNGDVGAPYTKVTGATSHMPPESKATGKFAPTTTLDPAAEAPEEFKNSPEKNSNVTSFSIALEGEKYVQYKYAVVYGDGSCSDAEFSEWATGNQPIEIDDQEVDGSRQLCVLGRDVYGHETSIAYSWTKDTTAPIATTVEDDNASTDTFSVDVASPGATAYRYAHLVGEEDCSDATYSSWIDLSIPLESSFTTLGSQLLCVQTVDAAGNISTPSEQFRPYAELSGLPDIESNDAALDITVSGTDVAEYRYAMVSGAASCSGVTLSSWINVATKISDATGADGDKILCVQARSSEGALQPLVRSYSWQNDSQPPAPPNLAGTPTNPSNSSTFDITVSGSDVYEYQFAVLTGAADCSGATYGSWTSASTKITSSMGSDGAKRLCVRARDRAQNLQTTPTDYAWIKDATAPVATLTGTPVAVSKDTSITITVDSPDDDATEYRYDLVSGLSCTSASYSTWTNVSTDISEALGVDGIYTLCVLSRDALQNEQAAVTTYTWEKDTTAPTATLSGTPASLSNSTTLNISISDSDSYQYKYAVTTAGNCTGASYGAYRDASLPITDALGADDVYRVCVISQDVVNNEQAVATEYSWTKDTVGPNAAALTLTGTPSNPSKDTALAVTVNGTDIAYYKYKVAAGATCSSSSGYSAEVVRATNITASVSGLADGSVTLCVWGRDAAGNYQDLADATSFTWTKDTVAPTAAGITLSALPADPSQDIVLDVDVSGTGVTHYQHKVGVAASTSCPSSTGYSAETAVASNITDNISSLTDTTLILCIIARDAAGNWTPVASAKSYSWFKDAHDPVPGNSGTITASNVDLSSMTVNWTKATDVDSATPQASLTYKVYQSVTNNLSTVSDMETCESDTSCTVLQTFIADINTLAVTGLTSNTVYYFNVIVKDDIGRQSAYTMFSQRTAPAAHIAYKDVTNNRVKYATNSSGSFATSVVESLANANISLALDSNNKAHISYVATDDLRYVTNKSGSWVATLVDSNYILDNTSIAVDSSNNPHISYFRFDSNKDWKYQYHNGTSWLGTPQNIFNGNGGKQKGFYSSLILDSSDKVHAVGHDQDVYDLVYNNNVSGSFSNNALVDLDDNNVAGAADVGRYTSIARDSSDNLYVGYYDLTNGNLKYIKRTTGTWGSAVTVDSTGDVGQYTGIAVTPNGYVHIVYYDVTNMNLKYACYNGSSWNVSTIDSTGDVGKYAAIVSDLGNLVHVSYYDATNANLKYAKGSCGGTWALSIVDSTGDVGQWTSIRIER
jgi:hypothetical protein